MNWILWLLFESPAALGGLLFLVSFGLLVRWRRGGSPRPLVGALLVSAALMTVQALVTTRDEAIRRALATIEDAVRYGEAEALYGVLADDFRLEELGRDAFVAQVRQRLATLRVHWLRRGDLVFVEETPQRCVVQVNYLADITAPSFGGAFRSRWPLTFTRGAHGWRISEIGLPLVEGQQLRSWSRIWD